MTGIRNIVPVCMPFILEISRGIANFLFSSEADKTINYSEDQMDVFNDPDDSDSMTRYILF